MHMLRVWLSNFTQHHSSPEWIAAFALLIQAGIFLLHARILQKHGKALDKTVEIAGTQAETGKLMATALDQQGTILAEQTKIMDEQFKFQRSAMAQADRHEVFSALISLRTSLRMLIAKIESPGTRLPERIAEEQQMQESLLAHTLPVQKAFFSSVHLTKEEKDYCGHFTVDVNDAVEGDANLPARLPKMKQILVKYPEAEFLKMVAKIAQPKD
jgi:hypothetical protein